MIFMYLVYVDVDVSVNHIQDQCIAVLMYYVCHNDHSRDISKLEMTITMIITIMIIVRAMITAMLMIKMIMIVMIVFTMMKMLMMI